MKYSYQLSEWMSKEKLTSIADRLSEEQYAIYDIQTHSKLSGEAISDEDMHRKGDYAVFTTGGTLTTHALIKEYLAIVESLREGL